MESTVVAFGSPAVTRLARWRLPLDHRKKALKFAEILDECAWMECIMLFE